MRDKTTLTSKVMAPDGSLHDVLEFRRPATAAETEALNALFETLGGIKEHLVKDQVIDIVDGDDGRPTYSVLQLPLGYKIVPSGS